MPLNAPPMTKGFFVIGGALVITGGVMSTANEQVTELAELAGSFIHEIKNHLSTLGLNVQLLAEDFQNPQSQRERRALERFHRLQAECQHLVDLSNDFLRFARVRDLDLRQAELGSVIEEMLDFFDPTARQASIDIKSYLPADLPPVRLDRELFKQALLNLLLNPKQAMPEGATLTIQATREPGAICLSLIDTGSGMGPDVLARVCKLLFSTKPRGTGLRLQPTGRLIHAPGAWFEVQHVPGPGTRVR